MWAHLKTAHVRRERLELNARDSRPGEEDNGQEERGTYTHYSAVILRLAPPDCDCR